MTNAPKYWTNDYSSVGAANGTFNVFALAANDHVRHVTVNGTVTLAGYPTNVIGDYAVWFGLVATFPAVAPVVPSNANSSSWRAGYWGRIRPDAVETAWYVNTTTLPAVRWFWHVDIDYSLDATQAGAMYIGFQQVFVDANHQTPIIGLSISAWGYAP